ncbi:hypothetical protein O1L60_01555 [Streptomyces diastatochromogenes]|nr:hypothetical protein [Streptomyces diastatochromogenes]
MELHTLTTRTTDPRERGTLLGTRFGARVRRVAELYREHFAVLGMPEAGPRPRRPQPRGAAGLGAGPGRGVRRLRRRGRRPTLDGGRRRRPHRDPRRMPRAGKGSARRRCTPRGPRRRPCRPGTGTTCSSRTRCCTS